MDVNNKLSDSSPFIHIACDYLIYKKSLGYKVDDDYQRKFHSLGKFLSRYPITGSPVLTLEMANAYVFQGNGENKNSTIHDRMSKIRQLAIFMNMASLGNYVFPEERIIRISKDDFTPYVFTHEEIARLEAGFQSLQKTNFSPLKYLVFPMLFRVLYCTGIRLSEALNLRLTDVDLENGIFLIRKPKNNRDRLVPLSLSLWEKVRKYYLEMQFSTGYSLYFFPTAKGNNYKPVSIGRTFKKLYGDCGIFNSKGKLPRIHDLRHTFCTHALEQMVDQGADVYCAIPYLCEYVGHRDISSTNAYLRLLPERFSDITKQMQEYCIGLIPEVEND
jgi:integrase